MSDIALLLEAFWEPQTIRVCTTTGGPMHDGEKWVHRWDYDHLKSRADAVVQAQSDEITAQRARLVEVEADLNAITEMLQKSRAANVVLEAALATARRDERERCAKVADGMAEKRDAEMTSSWDDTAGHEADFGRRIAEVIRALANEAET
jgi:hypothetical protein